MSSLVMVAVPVPRLQAPRTPPLVERQPNKTIRRNVRVNASYTISAEVVAGASESKMGVGAAHMNRMGLGRLLLTGILLLQSVLGFALDWSGNHLLNPLWHPHARFHGALLLFLLTGVSLMGVWLLWRQSKEPEIAIVVA